MPIQVKLQYKDALGGKFAHSDNTFDPFGRYFLNRGATVIKNHVYTPEIVFKNGQHIKNLTHLMCRVRDDGTVTELIIELNDSISRKVIVNRFCELSFIPGILAILCNSYPAVLRRRVESNIYNPSSGVNDIHKLSPEDIDRLIGEVFSEEDDKRHMNYNILNSEIIYIVAIFEKNLDPITQYMNYKGENAQSFFTTELDRIRRGLPRKSDISVEFLKCMINLHDIYIKKSTSM